MRAFRKAVAVLLWAVFLAATLLPASVLAGEPGGGREASRPGAVAVTFGARHEMYLDGKLFLPVHAWAAATGDLDRLAAMGVNVAYLSGTAGIAWNELTRDSLKELRTFLDECARRKMYAVLNAEAWLKSSARRGILKDGTLADYMGMFKDHPALLGWHISSEEDMGLGRKARAERGIEGWHPKPNGTTADIAERRRQVKAVDPDHPVLVMFSGAQMLAADRKFGWTVPTPEEFYLEAAKSGDIVYQDIFPVANNTADDISQVGDATRLLAKYARGRKHLWAAVDAGDRKRWSTKSHAPTGAEIRNELWQAVVEGAHGLGFDYTSWKPTWASIRMSEDGEKGLTAAVREIQALKEPILLGDPRVEVAMTQEATQGGEVRATTRLHDGKLYVFAVNVRTKPTTATIGLMQPLGQTAQVLGEKRTVNVVHNSIRDALDALGVHLYVIEKP